MLSVLYLLAGIGIMLFGVKMLSSGMQQVFGNKLRLYVGRLTKNKFVSTGFSCLSTFAMQSSSATTIMTVGFVGAGVITLLESLPMIIGANIGAALTHLILGFSNFNIKIIFASLTFIGAIMYMMKKPIIKKIGMAISGFGLLFAGLTVISSSVNEIVATIPLASFFESVSMWPLLILIGVLVCAVTQSSLSTLAILITLLEAGSVSFTSSAYILYGINIGTCLTALLVAFAYNSDSKRTAVYHVLFNVVLTIIFTSLTLLNAFNFLEFLTPSLSFNLILLDVFANVVTACIMLPLTKIFEKVLKKTIKSRRVTLEKIWSIDDESLESPTLALRILNENVYKAFLTLEDNYKIVKGAIIENRGKELRQQENKAEDFKKISDYIYLDSLKIYGRLNQKEKNQVENLHNQIICFVKIEDRFLKMIKTLNYEDRVINLSAKQKEVILKMDDILKGMMKIIKEVFIKIKEDSSFESEDYASVLINEVSSITKLKNESKLNIASLAKSALQEHRYTVFLKMMNDYERLGNYMCDIVLNSFDSRCRLRPEVKYIQTNNKDEVVLPLEHKTKAKREKINKKLKDLK